MGIEKPGGTSSGFFVCCHHGQLITFLPTGIIAYADFLCNIHTGNNYIYNCYCDVATGYRLPTTLPIHREYSSCDVATKLLRWKCNGSRKNTSTCYATNTNVFTISMFN